MMTQIIIQQITMTKLHLCAVEDKETIQNEC